MNGSGGSSSVADQPAGNPSSDLSKAESDVYDRQIRLWGLEAQNKLRNSSVLLCGVSGLGSEVVKNLMLCGLKSVTLMDEKLVTKEDTLANFLLCENPIGMNRATASSKKAQTLNPMVSFSVEERGIEEKKEDEIEGYSMIILIDQPYNVVDKWDKICREKKIRFVAGSVYGWTGYAFFDFNNHLFLMKQQKEMPVLGVDAPGEETPATIEDDVYEKKPIEYASYHDAFNVQWNGKKFLKKSKRLVPSSYLPIRAMLHGEQNSKFTGDEEKDVATFTEIWKMECAATNRSVEAESEIVNPSNFDYYFGPQLSPVCAIVGGFVGQEAIKALSENEFPLRNIFLYSAMDTSGLVVNYPPK